MMHGPSPGRACGNANPGLTEMWPTPCTLLILQMESQMAESLATPFEPW